MVLSVPLTSRAMSSVSVVPACPASDDDRWFAVDGGGVVQVARGGAVGGAFAPDDDVVQAKGKHHLFGDAILLRFSVGPQYAYGRRLSSRSPPW
jgi:hypothetical protein